MRPLVTFSVASIVPETLSRLNELTYNLYWTWCPTIRNFLRSIDPELWHRTNHQPLKMLDRIRPERLAELADDPEFRARYHDAIVALDAYRAAETWYGRLGRDRQEVIAYFSAEFGIHESLPLYSGGLGVLSGDHTKSASDLGLPFVGIGLMYQMGYFQQRLAYDGTQLESWEFNDPSTLPLVEVTGADDRPLRISVDFPEATVQAGVWRLDVGRIRLYLLDTNIAENTVPKYRNIADYLYGGDQEVRIMQEIMLGIGGVRALRALGIDPTVTHSNEGHSAFALLERTRMLMDELGLSFLEAAEIATAGAVFTTHTPVPAGHDVFTVPMMEQYFGKYWPKLGLSKEEFLSLGRAVPSDQGEGFSMTILALKLSSKHNGVSQLHGEVSREMWHQLWPGFSPQESPIAGITNGVHTETWVADPVSELFDAHVGADWRQDVANPSRWAGANEIPDEKLWSTKNDLRTDLIGYVRRRIEERQAEAYTRTETGRDPGAILDPGVFTIGFARRFATYKRATLLFRDPERAVRLFTDPRRPIQMVIAGKAHPKDQPGKEFVKMVTTFIHEHGLEHRIVFLEDYDMAVARHMVQGCDVWLNTPRRPMEASGTSGMKAAINGTLNLSILDGWWPEGFDGRNGFAIGDAREFSDQEHQDEYESRTLYRVLEEQVLPKFYGRDSDDVPTEWVAMQKHALATLVPAFTSDRMVQEYAERFYFPSSERFARLRADGGRAARDLIAWKRRIVGAWSNVRFLDATATTATTANHMRVGQHVQVTAKLALGDLAPGEVRVDAYHGGLDPDGAIVDGETVPLAYTGFDGPAAVYTGEVVLDRARRTGITVRALPWHGDLADEYEMNLVTWAGSVV